MAYSIKGNPTQGLFGATLGFFFGFAAVALFGPTAPRFREAMELGPLATGFLVAMPSLSGSLLRIPFAAWVETTGGRKPLLVLLALSIVGMGGLTAIVSALYPEHMSPALYPVLLVLALLSGCGIAVFSVGIGQVSYWFSQQKQGRALALYAGVGNLAPGIFTFLIPVVLATVGLAGCYVAWLALVIVGTVLYWRFGRNAWYFQYKSQGAGAAEARRLAAAHGQTLFPAQSLKASLIESARVWKTWGLVAIYFTTFGGFVGLTAWLPTYYTGYFGLSPMKAGVLAALFSILACLVRVGGGVLSDRLREGGENTLTLSLLITLSGALVMINAQRYELAIPGEILMAFGMGLCNAAVFKIVPQAVPHAVGGAAGWVGGLGAFGGFAIPPAMAFAVQDLGQPGYYIGFIVFIYLVLLSLAIAWVLKYTEEPAIEAAAVPAANDLTSRSR